MTDTEILRKLALAILDTQPIYEKSTEIGYRWVCSFCSKRTDAHDADCPIVLSQKVINGH